MDYIAFAIRALQMIFEKQFWKLIVFVWSVAFSAVLVVLAVNLPELLEALK